VRVEVPVPVVKEIPVIKHIEVMAEKVFTVERPAVQTVELIKEVPVEVQVEVVREVLVAMPGPPVEVVKEVEVHVTRHVPQEVVREIVREIEVVREVKVVRSQAEEADEIMRCTAESVNVREAMERAARRHKEAIDTMSKQLSECQRQLAESEDEMYKLKLQAKKKVVERPMVKGKAVKEDAVMEKVNEMKMKKAVKEKITPRQAQAHNSSPGDRCGSCGSCGPCGGCGCCMSMYMMLPPRPQLKIEVVEVEVPVVVERVVERVVLTACPNVSLPHRKRPWVWHA